MRNARAGAAAGAASQKEKTVTANECHCEHDATCALYGGQAMDAIATEWSNGWRGRQLAVGAGSWELATATSHEATKSNCVATDCALVRRKGDRVADWACIDVCWGIGGGWGVTAGGAFACLSSTAAAVTWTVVRAARVVRKRHKTNEWNEATLTTNSHSNNNKDQRTLCMPRAVSVQLQFGGQANYIYFMHFSFLFCIPLSPPLSLSLSLSLFFSLSAVQSAAVAGVGVGGSVGWAAD